MTYGLRCGNKISPSYVKNVVIEKTLCFIIIDRRFDQVKAQNQNCSIQSLSNVS